jgi:hypothetical protein
MLVLPPLRITTAHLADISAAGCTAVLSGPVGPICAANSELLFLADQQRVARRVQPAQNPKRRHGAFWIEHSLQVGPLSDA